jgi:hypothetical protein
MLGDGKDQMLQQCLLEQSKGTEWYLKLHKRLLIVAIHNTSSIGCFQITKTDSLKFRLSLAQGPMEKYSSGVLCPVHICPSCDSVTRILTELHFVERICQWKEGRALKKMCGMRETQEREKIYSFVS